MCMIRYCIPLPCIYACMCNHLLQLSNTCTFYSNCIDWIFHFLFKGFGFEDIYSLYWWGCCTSIKFKKLSCPLQAGLKWSNIEVMTKYTFSEAAESHWLVWLIVFIYEWLMIMLCSNYCKPYLFLWIMCLYLWMIMTRWLSWSFSECFHYFYSSPAV